VRLGNQGRQTPSRLLLVVGNPEREGVWRAVLDGFAGPLEVDVALGSAGTDACAAARGYQALVLDDPRLVGTSDAVQELRLAVEQGSSLVLCLQEGGEPVDPAWTDLTGARPAGTEPAAEWFLKRGFPTGTLTSRLPDEFTVTGALTRLDLAADCAPLLLVNIGHSDHTVVCSRHVGAGRAVVTGLRGQGSGGFDPELALVLRRALRPRSAEGPARHLGLGILGYGPYGGMGLHHGLAAAATEGLGLVAVCDSDPGRLKAAEEAFPGVKTSMSAGDLGADEEVDVVVVATPPVSHARLALSMLRAGKHVVVEKPMCITVTESDELIGAAAEEEVALTVYQSRRFDADFVAVRRLVAAGALGEVFNMETFVGGFEHPCRAWHSEESISGGAVYDWGSHHLDWILQLMGGFPSSLVAHGHKRVWRDVTNLDQVRVRLAWEDGREAEFVQSDVAGIRRPKFYVQGTAGTLAGWYRPLRFEHLEPGVGYVGQHPHHAEAPVDLRLARYEPGIGLTETQVPPARARQYVFHRNLVDHLQFGEPLAVTAASARKVVALLEAAHRSATAGNVTVALPRL
jgi:predicted dehydrogenase